MSGDFNSYTQPVGSIMCRQAVANKFSSKEKIIDPENIIIEWGGSSALKNAISTLCEIGDSLLIPTPGYPLYSTIC
jgi:tyrosine aminotransferase